MHTNHFRSPSNRGVSLRTTRIGWILLGFFLLTDVLALRFSGEIQATLTSPTIKIRVAVPTHQVIPTTVPTPAPVATVTAITHPTLNSASTLPAKDILAQDTFQRPDQMFWGVSSDGQPWGADAKNAQSFSIVNHSGQVTGSNGVYDAILGPLAVNSEVVFSGSVSHFTSSSLGALLRWTDANNLYKAFLGGGQLLLLKKVAGIVTVLKTVPFPTRDGVSYTIRFRAVGHLLLAKVWPTAQVETQTWMLMMTDRDLQSGYDGIRLVVQAGTMATITTFRETAL
jgi:hypothetical protein